MWRKVDSESFCKLCKLRYLLVVVLSSVFLLLSLELFSMPFQPLSRGGGCAVFCTQPAALSEERPWLPE